MQSERETVCRNILWILVAQLAFLALWSLIAQSGPVFVQRVVFGWDFRDFYFAAKDWLHGINPYLRPRFFTPPPSLLVGVFFAWPSSGLAVISFFALNLAIILASVRAVARKLGLSPVCINYLTWIALLYYPVYFLIERGNLEALILGCLCWAFCTRNRYVRVVLIALAAGLKIYPLLLLAPALRNKRWRYTLALLLCTLLLFLPFYRLMEPFLRVVIGRGGLYRQIEDISPAAVIIALVGFTLGKWIYLAFWTITLALMLYRHKHASSENLILPFLPWMVAFPLQVYPYGGLLLLPVLAWKLQSIRENGQGRAADRYDKLFVAGFLLVGLQATAFSVYFDSESAYALHGTYPAHPIFHWMNSLGMLLILASLPFQKTRSNIANRSSYPQENMVSP